MKKSMLLLITFVTTIASFSQISKGSMLVGGNIRFNSYKSETQMGSSKVRTLDIAPNVGYFLIDQFAVGIRPGLTLTSTNVPVAKLKSTTYTLAPFIRYYFSKNGKKVNVF